MYREEGRPLRWRVRGFGCLLILLAGMGVAGCSSNQPNVTESPKETRNLIFIATAYNDAVGGSLGRPPKDLEELKPYLKGMGALDDILVSPNDGLPYVIVWNARGRSPIAYEQKGKDGKRLVVDANLMPWRVTQQEFDRLKFPPSHKSSSPK